MLSVIVVYFPDIKTLSKLVESILLQDSDILIINNGCQEGTDLNYIFKNEKIIHLTYENNSGIGKALNDGLIYAKQNLYELIAFFDQDSLPVKNFFEILTSELRRLQKEVDPAIAVIAPQFKDIRNGTYLSSAKFTNKIGLPVKYKHLLPNESSVEVHAVITSGCIFDMHFFSDKMYFKADWFIEHIDFEWCYRIHSLGLKIYQSNLTYLVHEVSESTPLKIFGVSFFKYSSTRRYYWARNTLLFCLLSYVPFLYRAWILLAFFLRSFYMLLIDDNPSISLKLFSIGVVDAWKRRTGKLSTLHPETTLLDR